ncbi:hypothetical protein LX36DRAFT_490666 [Colletotrichum falcatum]|nr:hypothetical protein LX36DRAFT_490666 [Colletotrichum falcatum]
MMPRPKSRGKPQTNAPGRLKCLANHLRMDPPEQQGDQSFHHLILTENQPSVPSNQPVKSAQFAPSLFRDSPRMLLRRPPPRISAPRRGNYTYPYHHRPPFSGSMFLPGTVVGEGDRGAPCVRGGHAQAAKMPNTDAALDAVHCCRIHGGHTTMPTILGPWSLHPLL